MAGSLNRVLGDRVSWGRPDMMAVMLNAIHRKVRAVMIETERGAQRG
jgi:hypothetical protein